MNEPPIPNDLLREALDCLVELTARHTAAPNVKSYLDRVRQRHPRHRFRLVCHREAFDGSLAYDLLVEREGWGTMSMSFAPPNGLPWPLRGVHRWDEEDLLRVNGVVLKVQQAVAHLDFLWGDHRLTKQLVDVCLLHEAIDEHQISVSDAELQDELDHWRRERGLLTAELTHRWLEQRSLSHAQLEGIVEDQAKVARLRNVVVGGRVKDHFEANGSGYDRLCLASVDFLDPTSADLAWRALAAGDVSFEDLAAPPNMRASVPDIRPLTPPCCEWSTRRGLPRELAVALADAKPGDTLHPIQFDTSRRVVRLLGVEPAVLDDTTRAEVEAELFADWLDARRRRARIEWSWGRSR